MTTSTTRQDAAVEQYALLHRTVEKGAATNATWRRLITACVELDKREEAIEAFHSLDDPALRRRLRRDLARLGWVDEAHDEDEVRSMMVTDTDLRPSLRDSLEDALRFLLDGRMRTEVLAGTVAFPVVLGAGALLAGGTDLVVLRALAMLPALLVLGMLGVLCRHVLQLATRGMEDAADLPPRGQLLREVPAVLVDLAVAGTVFLGPAVLLVWLGVPLPALAWLVLAGSLMPMTVALRLTGHPWSRLRPTAVLAAVRRTSPAYLQVAGTTALLLAPAVTAFFLTLGMPVFLTLSVIGPLSVVPCLVAAHLMGSLLHYERDPLAGSEEPAPAS